MEFLLAKSGLWSRSTHLGLETVSRRTNVSSQSRLRAICLGLGPVGLVSGLGPLGRDVLCRRAPCIL